MKERDIFNFKESDGLKEKGNIDIFKRPKVDIGDGSIATVKSMSFQDENGDEVLIPTVSEDGKLLSERDAIMEYYRTGKHLGKFKDSKSASQYAWLLHLQQEEYYLKNNMKGD